MSTVRRPKRSSGFTLVELLVAIAVLGLILTFIGLEFVSVVDNTLHTRASVDAEAQARIVMAKVSGQMRGAYFDETDYPTAAPAQQLAVVSPIPVPSASPTGLVVFYRVSKGGLATIPVTCATGANQGAPCPPFELVTIQMSTTNPGELDEIVTAQPAGSPSSPTPIGQNVTNFGVTGISKNEFDVTLTVTQPSSRCVSDACSFTLNNVIYVGGQE